ncbi:hypothetical protein C1H46_032750 [Malus baccata]|uniref:Uncharacterized protein n=1 Tax=Malus baccata TaxID=106549 RepID=A0A540L5E5_MALBA|nr:hypothetical protein C1H46_032750 [Malus baccata]
MGQVKEMRLGLYESETFGENSRLETISTLTSRTGGFDQGGGASNPSIPDEPF